MDFNQPATENPADRQRVLGKSTPRIDGPLKTTGTAPYAYERHDVAEGQLVGYPLGSAIAKGRIVSMDTSEAEAAPGVQAVIRTTDMDVLGKFQMNVVPLFGGPEILHYHQAIALVVADSFEEARAATALIRVEYDEDETDGFDLAARREAALEQEGEIEQEVGDFETAFAEAAVTLDETYTTPAESHAMMEPHATIALWEGEGNLSVWTSNQMVAWNVQGLCDVFGLNKENVHVDSPFIGGGFGVKLFVRADAVLAALGSRETGRPVKVALPRPMIANNTTHRAETIQRIRIGANEDGTITAIGHDGMSETQPGGRGENCTAQTPVFYAGPNRLIVNRLVDMYLPEANAMRAPGEASGLMALEIAMDEMAEKLGMDPVEFRAINDTQVDPGDPEKAFSERHFVECLRQGAERFGWADRNQEPGSRREGMWLIGHGMAGGYRGAPSTTSAARVRLQPDGTAIVETDMTDIGTGSYTIIAQTAAEMLGLGVDKVEVRLGDSSFPVSAGSGGQWGASSSTAGTYAACVKLREEIARRLGNDDASALEFADGKVTTGDRTVPLTEIASDGEIVAEDTINFGDFREKFILATFAAHFVEVAVHVGTGETRVRRMLAVCDAGRILNPLSARSQVIGGMVMGIGAALMEELAVDTGRGFFANHDLAGYEVPVHADIHEQEVVFLDTEDATSTPLKAKGVGELGLCGIAAAVANAHYNATGVRIRDYPLTLDKVLDRLPTI
ncbi:xanthine dehydrogenase family protein molybdopterin-binding subunit [Paracoccus aurantiacus]|uniref:Xanthine dehydrogenase family protein molybdopterin-binding subunit n=1 Tax=Paracoccus aurantiacus TaxID=2599412 RepID=A0A5C6S6T1_9RHOB|nr:aldehyde oxidoreductase molybdenum-binding subunit PaoC [Paracoccus aurantiacus]TXB69761.1 xanthine dehydrogenase family protein molybdopterin-binding subunit [Paracoccus aurantiacus]